MSPVRKLASLPRKYVVLAVVWSGLIGASIAWEMQQGSTNTIDTAAAAARAGISKDFTFRRWATSHGGVYVPPTEHTPPNPYLQVPDRDVVTTTGKKLTLMNPAYILRELQNNFPDEYGTKSHITSLKLLNPKNAPDAWEAEALHTFERGEKERVEVQQIDGQPYLRLMRPLIAEQGCLKCHGFQGYKVGDVRGGLSTSIPLTPYLAREKELDATFALTYGATWLIGIMGFGVSCRRESALCSERENAERQLRASSQYMRSLIEASPDPLVTISREGKITDVNKATEGATGLSRSELIGTDFSDYFTEPAKAREGYQRVFSEGSVTDYPLAIRHKNGNVTDVLYNASVYRNESGEVAGVFAAARDITERKRAQEILQQREEALIEAQRIAHVGSWHLDFATNEVYWSEELYKMYGYDPKLPPPLYTDSMKLFTPESWERLSSAIARAAETGISYELELEMVPKDGGHRWMLARGELVRDAEGRPVRVRGVAMDITERKKAEIELREVNHNFVTLLENTSDFIYFKDKDSRFIFCSQPLASITGHQSWRDMIGKHDLEVFPADTARIYYEEELPIFREGKPLLNRVDPYYDDQGKRRWVSTNKWPVLGEDGKTVIGIFGISRDITELKEAGEKIQELNRDLERRVAERTMQLEVANRELEAFSYSVSHDLRSPLRAIDGFSRIVIEEYAGKLDAEGTRLLNVMRDNAAKMEQLIDDILQFSRAGRTELDRSEIDMQSLTREVYEELRTLVAGHAPEFEIERIPPATGDRAMMRQVLVNLLSNAIKFSRNKAPAMIKVGAFVQNGETVYFVRDNGAGFDMRYVDKLFGVFQRLHATTEFEGTGIGLAIVKRIINRHGGRVWAEGKVGEGATFYFSLPAATHFA